MILVCVVYQALQTVFVKTEEGQLTMRLCTYGPSMMALWALVGCFLVQKNRRFRYVQAI